MGLVHSRLKQQHTVQFWPGSSLGMEAEEGEIVERGEITSGKKGKLPMYFIKRLKPEFSKDQLGLKTNEIFEQKFGQLMKIYGS